MRLDETELCQWGRHVGQAIATPVVIALTGPLGAGKSVLARAIGAGAGVGVSMPSPSFNLLLRYETKTGRPVVHCDLYRLRSADEVWELGWEQIGADGEIVIVEWPERAEELMPADHWRVELSTPKADPQLRDVSVRRVGNPPELNGFPISVSAK